MIDDGAGQSVPPMPKLVRGHLDELHRSGISATFAQRYGVYSAERAEDLPSWAAWLNEHHGSSVLPALVFPMQELDGAETGQIKPAPGSVVDATGRVLKYISPSDSGEVPFAPQLPVVVWPKKRKQVKRVLIVEGVKQALAVAEHAPKGSAVLRICGITGWSRRGVPTPRLAAVAGHDVVIIPDADASTNRSVYDGASQLAEACRARGAASVKFVRVPGAGSAGIDDLLGAESESNRATFLKHLVLNAAAKPADRAPRPESAITKEQRRREDAMRHAAETRRTEHRPIVHVGDDRLKVITTLSTILERDLGGRELFRHGAAFGQLVDGDHGPRVITVGDGELANLIARTAQTLKGQSVEDIDGCMHAPEWPDRTTMSALHTRYRDFPALDGIARTPLVRMDGSIVTDPGYDPESRHVIALSPELDGFSVPQHPTDDQVAAAVQLLTDELLGDFLLASDTDMAHAVAALLTPLLRPILPTAPFLVVDGLQRGVGKGKLLAVIAVIGTGYTPSMSILPTNEEEMRKTITSILHEGSTMLMWDEVQAIDSASLNSLVTAESWSDRKLGATKQIEMPNRSTIYFAGNNVIISGDAVRRAVTIRLSTDEPNPENRSGFRHELPTWAFDNRQELLEACMTLITAWIDRGRPAAPRAFQFGSFERWQDVLGGILMVAGIPGFLDGLEDRRQDTDYEDQYWSAHLAWLCEEFDVGVSFTAREARTKARADVNAEMPPGLETDVTARVLGQHYATQVGRWRGGLRLQRAGQGQGGSVKWVLEEYTPAGTGQANASTHQATSLAASGVVAPASVPRRMQPLTNGACQPVVTDLPTEAGVPS